MRNTYRAAMLERINRGVAWLDSLDKDFWDGYAAWSERDRDEILDVHWLDLDLKYLNLRIATTCILGHAGGNYNDVVNFANMNYKSASYRGFLLDANDYGRAKEFTPAHYSMFTELWVDKITQLRVERREADCRKVVGG